MPDIFQAFTIDQVARIGFSLLVLIAGIVSILFVIWGGFLMIISGGNEEKVKGAVNHIRHAFLGVLLIVAVLFVFPAFLDLLGVEYGDYMRPSSVFSSIGELSDMIFGTSIDSTPYGESSGSPMINDDFSDL